MNDSKLIIRYPRLIGGLFALLGLLLIYLCILLPVKAAQHHAPNVSISMGGIFMAVFSLLSGLVFLIFGTRYARFFVTQDNAGKAPVYLSAALISFMGLATYILLQKYLQGFGYVF